MRLFAREQSIIILLICFLIGCSRPQPELPERPNIVLLVVDALRADYLGCYNPVTNLTPNIDRFAERSFLFSNAYAQTPYTIGSAGAIFSSAYQSIHGHQTYDDAISSELDTLAELLRDNGYITMGITTNPHVTSRHGLDRGFDTYIEDLQWKATDCDEVNERFFEWFLKDYLMELKWRKGHDNSPFFAMLWYIDPHSSYEPPQEYIDKFITQDEQQYISRATKVRIPGYDYTQLSEAERGVTKKLYQGEVNFFDSEFGKLMDFFQERKLLKNTIVILTADHGEAFWEKGWREEDLVFGHPWGPLIAATQKIPLIVYLPDHQDGVVIRENVQQIDLAPTVLEYAGIDPKKTTFMGDSLRSLIDGDPGLFDGRKIFSESINRRNVDNTYKAVIQGAFKLVRWKKNNNMDPEYKLFNVDYEEVEYDINQSPYREKYLELKDGLLEQEKNLAQSSFLRQKAKEISSLEKDKLQNRLKALGYMQ